MFLSGDLEIADIKVSGGVFSAEEDEMWFLSMGGDVEIWEKGDIDIGVAVLMVGECRVKIQEMVVPKDDRQDIRFFLHVR